MSIPASARGRVPTTNHKPMLYSQELSATPAHEVLSPRFRWHRSSDDCMHAAAPATRQCSKCGGWPTRSHTNACHTVPTAPLRLVCVLELLLRSEATCHHQLQQAGFVPVHVSSVLSPQHDVKLLERAEVPWYFSRGHEFDSHCRRIQFRLWFLDFGCPACGESLRATFGHEPVNPGPFGTGVVCALAVP